MAEGPGPQSRQVGRGFRELKGGGGGQQAEGGVGRG